MNQELSITQELFISLLNPKELMPFIKDIMNMMKNLVKHLVIKTLSSYQVTIIDSQVGDMSP